MKTETSKMELEIPSAEEPVVTRRNVPLAISDVDHLFVYHKCNKTVPFRPKGGEVYDDPTLDGLQSCCYAEKPCFRPTTDTFIQILNTHPMDGGLHWVTVATYESRKENPQKLTLYLELSGCMTVAYHWEFPPV